MKRIILTVLLVFLVGCAAPKKPPVYVPPPSHETAITPGPPPMPPKMTRAQISSRAAPAVVVKTFLFKWNATPGVYHVEAPWLQAPFPSWISPTNTYGIVGSADGKTWVEVYKTNRIPSAGTNFSTTISVTNKAYQYWKAFTR